MSIDVKNGENLHIHPKSLRRKLDQLGVSHLKKKRGTGGLAL